ITYAFAAFSVLVDFWPLRYYLLANTGMFGGADRGAPLVTLDVFRLSSSEGMVTLVFVVAALATLALALGVLPRLAAFVTYAWVLSYSDTAQTALSGFDTILRCVGFVLVVGPQVPTWSVGPRWAKGSSTRPSRYGLRMIQWQLMLIYVCTVWLKAPDEFWRRGEAITYFMMSMFARHPSAEIAHHTVLGELFTYATLVMEASIPFLLWMRRTRMLGVAVGLALHLGIGFGAKLALFTLAMVPLYLSFFEAEDFEWLRSWWPPPVTESNQPRA
ncbi:MAG TPA: HTTM domain-containing protein, partial [Polyangiaceae bacterium]|nr:HTTM domain-containing protein [Polyangiaceae bacterium]